jgi:hypothetical protein
LTTGGRIQIRLQVVVLASLLPLLPACSETPHEATLDELIRRPDFQQCMMDSGVAPSRISDCLANNPDEPSARACIAARAGKNNGPESSALNRCYNLSAEPAFSPSSPIGLNCSQSMTGNVTCK